MASIYILYSEKLNRYYIGSCKDLNYRIGQHINKDYPQSFTRAADDWELFFFKDDLEYQQARLIEQHIKNMKSKIYIQNLKNHLEIFEKLIQKYNA